MKELKDAILETREHRTKLVNDLLQRKRPEGNPKGFIAYNRGFEMGLRKAFEMLTGECFREIRSDSFILTKETAKKKGIKKKRNLRK